MKRLTPRLEDLLEAFDRDAQVWGWQEDQGYGSAVDRAEKRYKESKAELVAYLSRLQARSKRRKTK